MASTAILLGGVRVAGIVIIMAIVVVVAVIVVSSSAAATTTTSTGRDGNCADGEEGEESSDLGELHIE